MTIRIVFLPKSVQAFGLCMIISGCADAKHKAMSLECPGDVHAVAMSSEMKGSSERGSKSSSRSSNVLIERVVERRGDTLILEIDLPYLVTDVDRAREWRLPARILRQPDGTRTLLNAGDLETRLIAWLKLGEIDREACGEWIFTWTAVKIECDPTSILEIYALFDIRYLEIGEGRVLTDPNALNSTTLAKIEDGPNGRKYYAEFEIDPATRRHERAEMDVVTAKMIGEGPDTLEAALDKRSTEQISGSINITLTTDITGNVIRKERLSETVIETIEGDREITEVKQVVERRPIETKRLDTGKCPV